MWQLEQPSDNNQPGTTEFLAEVNSHPGFFEPGPLYVGRAPGRLDLMGGIADYSGSLVLELPLEVATFVAAQAVSEPVFEIFSPGIAAGGDKELVRWPLPALVELDSGKIPEEDLRKRPGESWVSYPAGVWALMQKAYGFPADKGVKLLVYSLVPTGKGVSSSAALEVATLQALAGLYGLDISGKEAALLCQQAENTIVGAPCGIMDQMTVACGQADALLALRCQPAELEGNIELPAKLAVWGLDSGIRHAVSGADYTSVRVGAFMGYRIIAGVAGLEFEMQPDGTVRIEDPRWQGYLANLSPSLWENAFQAQVPEQIRGAEFLEKWGGTTDKITRVEPNRLYEVRQATAHPIYENHRVQLFRALLSSPAQNANLQEEKFRLLGELMFQSHQSYTRCGLDSVGTDRLVEMVREAGPEAGLYGAKITGGGSGGTAAVLGRQDAGAAIEQIAALYASETGYSPQILSRSSAGAMTAGGLRLAYKA